MKYTEGQAFIFYRDDNYTKPEVVTVESLRSRGGAKLSNGWVVDEDGRSEGTKLVKGAYVKPVDGSFEYWFADCMIIALDNRVTPNDYVWDLYNCPGWKEKFERGLTSEDAVAATFKAH